MLFGSTSRRFGPISIFPSIPIAIYRIIHILGKVVQGAKCWVSQRAADHQSGSSAERRRHWRRAVDGQAKGAIGGSEKREALFAGYSAPPPVSTLSVVVAGVRWRRRRRQRLWGHALDLAPAIRPDHDSLESHVDAYTTARIIGSERRWQHAFQQTSERAGVFHGEPSEVILSSNFIQGIEDSLLQHNSGFVLHTRWTTWP